MAAAAASGHIRPDNDHSDDPETTPGGKPADNDAARESGVADLAHELRPLVFGLYDVVRRRAGRLALTPTQSSVLSVLIRDGPQRMGVLATREGVRLPTMTNVVARMERLGYLRRRPEPADGRVVVVEATDQARDDVAAVVLAREEFLRERLVGLSGADRAAISTALGALTRLIEYQEDDNR